MELDLSKFSQQRISALILIFFLLSAGGLYIGHNSSLDVEIASDENLTEEPYGTYRNFSYTLTNQEDESIRPKFWIIRPHDRGISTTHAPNISILPGETKNVDISIAEKDKSIIFGSSYQLLVKDVKSEEVFTKRISINKSKPDKNPYFLHSDYYPYHWSGSSYGKGHYNVNTSGYGMNATFENCNQIGGCGFVYRDDYKLQPLIKIKGNSFNLDKKAELKVVIKDTEEVGIPINISDKNRFETIIDVESVYNRRNLDFSEKKVVYELKYRTHNDSFHWLRIEELNFYRGR